jgi:hypothetical protein
VGAGESPLWAWALLTMAENVGGGWRWWCWDVVVGLYFLDLDPGIVLVLTCFEVQTTWAESAIKSRSQCNGFPSAIGMVTLLYPYMTAVVVTYVISFEYADGYREIHEHGRER